MKISESCRPPAKVHLPAACRNIPTLNYTDYSFTAERNILHWIAQRRKNFAAVRQERERRIRARLEQSESRARVLRQQQEKEEEEQREEDEEYRPVLTNGFGSDGSGDDMDSSLRDRVSGDQGVDTNGVQREAVEEQETTGAPPDVTAVAELDTVGSVSNHIGVDDQPSSDQVEVSSVRVSATPLSRVLDSDTPISVPATVSRTEVSGVSTTVAANADDLVYTHAVSRACLSSVPVATDVTISGLVSGVRTVCQSTAVVSGNSYVSPPGGSVSSTLPSSASISGDHGLAQLPVSNSTGSSTPISAVPGIPQSTVPTPAVPGIPQSSVPISTVPGIPQSSVPIPAVPGIPQSSAPISTVPGIPQSSVPVSAVPGIPQSSVPISAVPSIPHRGVPTSVLPGIPQSSVPISAVHSVPHPGVPISAVPVIPHPGVPISAVPSSFHPGVPISAVPGIPGSSVGISQCSGTSVVSACSVVPPNNGLARGVTGVSLPGAIVPGVADSRASASTNSATNHTGSRPAYAPDNTAEFTCHVRIGRTNYTDASPSVSNCFPLTVHSDLNSNSTRLQSGVYTSTASLEIPTGASALLLPAVSRTSTNSTSNVERSTTVRRSAPTTPGFNVREFENQASDPFDSVTLKSLDDMQELADIFGRTAVTAVQPSLPATPRVFQPLPPTAAPVYRQSLPPTSSSNRQPPTLIARQANSDLPVQLARQGPGAPPSRFVAPRIGAHGSSVATQSFPTSSSDARALHEFYTRYYQPVSNPTLRSCTSVPDLSAEAEPSDTNSPTAQTSSTPGSSATAEQSASSSQQVSADDIGVDDTTFQRLKQMSEMGFPLRRLALFHKHFKGEEKQVIDAALLVRSLESEQRSHSLLELAVCEVGVEDRQHVVEYYQVVHQLIGLGFERERVIATLRQSGVSQDRALDLLLNTR